jgi:hypothetical protein
MTSKLYFISICLLLSLVTGSCVEPYTPPAITGAESYLVVEGFINSGSSPTTFILSRTRNQENANNFIPEVNARMAIESETGDRYILNEQTPGMYTGSPLNLNNALKYRIHIQTYNDKEYASEYVEIKRTPLIDTLTWSIETDGVQIYVDTHDAENNTRYYRWEAQETWEYVSAFFSNYVYKNNQMVLRSDQDQIYTCWDTDNSKEIFLGSSARLKNDVIYRQPITFAPVASGKLLRKYSILVSQYALSRQGFEYWQILKKNTESTGSIFDAQPSQLQGNIRCINNPQEPVIGFVDASTVSQKRIFIDRKVLPFRMSNVGYELCDIDTVANLPKTLDERFADGNFLAENPLADFSGIIAYTYSDKRCVDCREKGGTTTKPDFWE